MSEENWTDITPNWGAVPLELKQAIGYTLSFIALAAFVGAAVALCGWIYTSITGKAVLGREMGLGAFLMCLGIAVLGGNLVAWVDWGVKLGDFKF